MFASSVDHGTSSVSSKNNFRHEPRKTSHRICPNPFIFVLLLYDVQAMNLSFIIEIGVLGITVNSLIPYYFISHI